MKHSAQEKRRIAQAFEKFWKKNSVLQFGFDIKYLVRFAFTNGYNTAMNDLLRDSRSHD